MKCLNALKSNMNFSLALNTKLHCTHVQEKCQVYEVHIKCPPPWWSESANCPSNQHQQVGWFWLLEQRERSKTLIHVRLYYSTHSTPISWNVSCFCFYIFFCWMLVWSPELPIHTPGPELPSSWPARYHIMPLGRPFLANWTPFVGSSRSVGWTHLHCDLRINWNLRNSANIDENISTFEKLHVCQ